MNLNYWSGGSPVSMGEILDARESRAAIQKEMLKRNPGCLVCLTLNIPGPVKTFPFVRWLYEVGKGNCWKPQSCSPLLVSRQQTKNYPAACRNSGK